MSQEQVQQPTQTVDVGEDISDVGGYIVKNGNQRLDGYDQPEDATEVESDLVTEDAEPSTITENSEVDLSIFDELDKTPEATEETQTQEETPPPGFEKFSEDFKKYMGFDMKEAMSMVQELQGLRAEITIKEQERSIKNAWNVDDTTYNARMQEIRTYAQGIQNKNPELFKKLDNPEGVQLIWAKLESEKAKGVRKSVPTIQGSSNKTPATQKAAYEYTYSQLQKMSRDEYAKNANKIARAWQEGRVNTRA